MKDYLRRLLDEKGVSQDYVFTIDTDDYWGHHIIPMEVLIEFIDNMDPRTQTQIKQKLVLIDFKNGDVLHFLEFITRKMVEVQFN
ncbi:MAG: hypothetical protein IPN14_10075 [Bacteroidetes bacterium]|jgi:hypothetical protein|nr:hypothetical protein [Bacteroidota bacterium]